MEPIQGAAPPILTPSAATRPAGRGGFNVPGGVPAARAAGVAQTSWAGLLTLQEAGGDAVQDREARKHGHDLLAELARLQRDLLSGPPNPIQLQRLADLAQHVPEAADPGLRDIVAEISLRARIESVRYANDVA